MTKTRTLLFGVATIAWPLLVPGVAILIQIAFPYFRYGIIAGVTVSWFCFTALFVYIMFHAMKNPALPAAKKSRWMMYLLFCNVVAVPVYWYRYIWRTKLN